MVNENDEHRVNNNWVLEDGILKVMVKLGTPIAVGEAMNILYSMADIYWLGRIGRDALASVSASWPVIWLIVSVAAGIFSAGVALISQYWGKSDFKKAMMSGGQVLVLSIIFGIPIAISGFVLIGKFLAIIGVPATTLEPATEYARILALGIPLIAIYESISAIYTAAGDTITPLKIRSVGVVINVILDPILIFGYLNLPSFGVVGAATATVVSQFVVSVLSITYLGIRGVEGLRISLQNLKPKASFIKQILKIGYPISILMVSEAGGFVLLVHIISLLGPTPLAAWGIADRLLGLFHVFIAGLLGATSTMIGQSLGAQMEHRARTTAKKTALYGAAIMACGLFILIPMRYQIAYVFAPNDELLVKQVADFILIMGPSVIFFTIYLAARAVARGSGHTKPVMIFGMIRLWILRNSLAYLFAIPVGLGVKGLWIGMAVSNYITGSLALWWIIFGKWDKAVISKVEKISEPTPI
ncbi:MATE family efflux transporter [Geoglobus sp.]